ncbi:MAG: histidine kinase [Bacteroidota bacterium]
MENSTDNIYVLVAVAMAGAVLLVVLSVLLQIRNQNKILKQQRKLQQKEMEHQKEMLYALINSQEIERKRIGIDLHDEVGSALSSLRMMIEMFVDKGTGETETMALRGRCKSTIDNVISNVRNIAHDLSPLTAGTCNLNDVIEDLCDSVNETGKLSFRFINEAEKQIAALDNNKALALYRVVTELVNNTIKHADAKHIILSITKMDTHLLFVYKDDGRGLTGENKTTSRGMGMSNIAGRLDMLQAAFTLSDAGEPGYQISVQLPVDLPVSENHLSK